MDTTGAIPLASVFVTLFDRDALLDLARQTEAVERLREVHPADLVRALIECASGDEKRSLAACRRRYGRISFFEPEESSFYDHFNPGLVRLLERLLRRAMKRAPGSCRRLLSHLLDHAGLADMLALDASRFSLPSWAKELYPSTDDQHGGVKLTTLMSVLSPAIKKFIVTDARQHDRKVVKLPRWLHGLLILMDRGYCDRKLFAQIADRFGFFLTRLKKSHRPVIKTIRCGLDQRLVGQPFSNELPFEGEVDLDATFKMPDRAERAFRVVRLVVGSQLVNGTEEPVELLFVTNLTPEQFTVGQLATLYRFRWEIERLFAVCKGVGRLDQLRSGKRSVIEAFVYASLLAVVLGLQVCSWMRQQRPGCEPSAWRVTTLVLEWLPELARAAGHPSFKATLAAFERVLWREGVNPNPGRPFTATQYTLELGWQEACRRASR